MWNASALSSSTGAHAPAPDDAAGGPAHTGAAPALDRLRGVDASKAGRDDPIAACRQALMSAQHLSPDTRAAALTMLTALAREGCVRVPEGDTTRKSAVAGVQWAMETTLRGTEVIVTPERATPLRTIGDADRPEAQRVRGDALQARFHRGNPLHLVFCRDGMGTPEEDAAYRRLVLIPALEEHLPLREHVLPMTRAHFPPALSGAFIVAAEAPATAFAIRAAQADKLGIPPCLTLWWISPGLGAGDHVLGEWGRFLAMQTGRPMHALLGDAAASLGGQGPSDARRAQLPA